MKMIAAAGDIDMKALSDSINLLAKLNITQTANQITITATEEVVINGGGSYARFHIGGIEHGTNGSFVAHASTHSFIAPKNMARNNINLISLNHAAEPAAFSQQVNIEKMLYNDPELHGAIYEIWTTGKEAKLLAQGTINDSAKTVRVFTEKSEDLEIIIGENEWAPYIHTTQQKSHFEEDVELDSDIEGEINS